MPWYAPEDPTPREACPCCGYVTLAERGGYEICPVCFWEDNGLRDDRIDTPSGPNRTTLRQGRANFEAFGACDRAMLPHVVAPGDRSRFLHRPIPAERPDH